MGFSVNNTKAVFEGLLDKKAEFVRTPKYQIMDKKIHGMEGIREQKKLSFHYIY